MSAEARLRRLERILVIGQELASMIALDPLLNRIVAAAVEVVAAEEAAILLLDPQADDLRFCATSGECQLADTPVSLYDSIAGKVFLSGQPLLIPAVPADAPCRAEVARWATCELSSFLAVPLLLRDRSIGVLQVVNKQGGERFSREDVNTLTGLAAQAAMAIENVRLSETVEQQSEELRVLAARLAEAEETERRRLARELHDLMGQDLTLLGLNLNSVREGVSYDDAARTCLEDSLDLVRQIAEHIRAVIAGLRPPELDNRGLLAALRRYGDEFAARSRISVRVRGTEPDPGLRTAVKDALFRIVQEALTNVAKHAQATEVEVALLADNGRIYLTIVDNGVGFDPTCSTGRNAGDSWGLLTMGERAEAVGGRCYIQSRPQYGTRLVVEVGR